MSPQFDIMVVGIALIIAFGLIQSVTDIEYPWLVAVGAFFILTPLMWSFFPEPPDFPTVLPDREIEALRNSYIAGAITLEDFEERVDRKLKGLPEPKPELREGFTYIPDSATLTFTDKNDQPELIAGCGRPLPDKLEKVKT